MRKTTAGLCALAGAVSLGIAGMTPANAAGTAAVSAPIAQNLAGPLQFAVGNQGNLVVGQDFAGTLTAVDDNTSRKDLVSRPGKEIAGGAVTDGYIVFGAGAGTEEQVTASTLERRRDGDGVQ